MLNLLLTLLTLAVIGGVAALFTGFFTGGGLGAPESTVPERALPAGPIAAADLEELRFVRALRGYRMDQVDAAIDRLGAEIESLHSQLAGRDLRELDDEVEPGDEHDLGEPDLGEEPGVAVESEVGSVPAVESER